ncbi:unnamed protein product [Clonostachys chloroleuca]|uniref:Peptidase S8/S53 domain-containing protein n=1 Tax=Clonostachys chloroleuca TaxID=1926264 RepID=A0AA35M2I8_9HYPO|nr:unnamed protein product [Clonostachys chloroleuca]
MYACSAWSNTSWGTRGGPYTKHTLAKLESLQARAARMISGAFRATSGPALDVETHLPMEHQIWKHNLEALIRLAHATPYNEYLKQLYEDDTDILSNKYWLGKTLFVLKKYDDAEKAFRQTVDGREKKLSADNRDTLKSRYCLALTLYRLHKYVEAEGVFRETVAGWEKRLGEKHTMTLLARYWLAKALFQQGKYNKAEGEFRQTLQGREEMLGVDHPSPLSSRYWLARTLYQQDKYDEAEELFRQTVEGREKSLREDDTHTLLTRHWLARTLYQLKKYDEAERAFRQIVETVTKKLGADDIITSESRFWLSMVLSQLEKDGEAEEALLRTVCGRETKIEQENSDTQLSNSWLDQALVEHQRNDTLLLAFDFGIEDSELAEDQFQESDLEPEASVMDEEDFELFGKDQTPHDHEYRIGPAAGRIKVAILDTGIDIKHPTVQNHLGRIKKSKSFIGGDATVDNSGHGTHIAGILLDLTTHVDLYIGKFTESRIYEEREDNAVRQRIVNALRHARTEWEVHAISLSFGYRDASRADEILIEINKCLNAGIVVFASASNDGGNGPSTYPGNYNRVLCIYSADGNGEKSPFSPSPEVRQHKDNFSTLGGCINSPWPSKDVSAPGATWKRMSGTSFATPVAVSIAAFMIGYIRKQLPNYGWNVDPSSPEGVRAIFRVMSEANKRDGYDLISPMWFFRRYSKKVIEFKLVEELLGYQKFSV